MIIPRIFRIMGNCPVTAPPFQGMARVRSGQARAWPLISDRKGAEAPPLKGGPEDAFLRIGLKGSSGAP
jgi:hypothetical protein